MKETELSKLTIIAFLIGVLVMTLFLPVINNKKNYPDQSLNNVEIVKASSTSSSSDETSFPLSINLMEEEEEIEHLVIVEKDYAVYKSSYIKITFSSPNLFFKDHFIEVSGPPPWA